MKALRYLSWLYVGALLAAFAALAIVAAQVAALSVMSPWMLIPAALLFAPALFLGYCQLREACAT